MIKKYMKKIIRFLIKLPKNKWQFTKDQENYINNEDENRYNENEENQITEFEVPIPNRHFCI